MIDIHTHILPGADHGVQDRDETWKILTELSSLGFRRIVFTPHVDLRKDKGYLERLSGIFESFFNSSETIQLQVEASLGSEVVLCTELIEHDPISPLTFTLNESTYQLVEIHPLLHPVAIDSYCSYAEYHGIKPVIAHVERVDRIVKDPELIKKLKDVGCLFQVDIMSFSGSSDRELEENAEKLLSDGQIDILATDCHSIYDMDRIKSGLQFIKGRIPKWENLFKL